MVYIHFFEKSWIIVHGFPSISLKKSWTIVHGFHRIFRKNHGLYIVHGFHHLDLQSQNYRPEVIGKAAQIRTNPTMAT